MPLLVGPSLPAGSLRALGQPHLDVGDGTTLRPWRETDVQTVMAAFACPDIQRWHVRRMDTADEARSWITGWVARWDDETDASWAIADSRDQPVGQVGLRAVSLFEASADLSYWVLPEARGAGVAVRATDTLTRWAFDTVGLHRISLEHSTANLASCRVATRLGLDLEGILRGAVRHADGWHDMHRHARLRHDEARPPKG
ncbi:GNAT family N-acetyltransferase [Lentzea sp. NPDC054927]